MSILKFTVKRTVTLFGVLVAVVLITSVVVSFGMDLFLEDRTRIEVIEEIKKNPSMCDNFLTMEECIDYYVNLRLGR